MCVPSANVRTRLTVRGQESTAEDKKNKLNTLKKAEKERANQIKRLEKSIEETEDRLANPPQTEDLGEIVSQIVRIGWFVMGAVVLIACAETTWATEQPEQATPGRTARAAASQH